MKISRVQEGTLQIMLSPCLVFVGRSVRFSLENIQNYLDAGCCVYREGYHPLYAEVKYSPGLESIVGQGNVRVIGTGMTQFHGLDVTSHVLGHCYCPAGCKGYFEVKVDECEQGTARIGFCSKNWVMNVKKSVHQDNPDKETWGNEEWTVSLDGLNLSDHDGKTQDIRLSAGDVIGLGCEIYGNAQEKTQPGLEGWEPWVVSNSMEECGSDPSSRVQSNDQLLTAEEIYKLEPGFWSSDTSSIIECRGNVRVWVYNKMSQQIDSSIKREHAFEIKLTGLDSLE